MARYFGDRTAEMLGRLSLNPLRHIDPIGTVLVPGLLLAVGGPLFGWAKPVPVATSALRNPRRAMIMVALAGPAANLLMAALWCGVLAVVARINGNQTLDYWIAAHGAGGYSGQCGSRRVQSAAHSAARRRPGAGGLAAAALGRAAGENRAGRHCSSCWDCRCCGCSAGCSTPRSAPSGTSSTRLIGTRRMSGPIQNRRVLSGMRPTGPAASGQLSRCAQELDRAAVSVRMLFLHRRLARADHGLRGHLEARGARLDAWPSTGWRRASIPASPRCSSSRKCRSTPNCICCCR